MYIIISPEYCQKLDILILKGGSIIIFKQNLKKKKKIYINKTYYVYPLNTSFTTYNQFPLWNICRHLDFL